MGSGASTEPEAAAELADEEKVRIAKEVKSLLSSPMLSDKDQLDGIMSTFRNSRMPPDTTAAAAAAPALTATTEATATTAPTTTATTTTKATEGSEKLTIESSDTVDLTGNGGFVRSPPRLLSFISMTPSKKRPDDTLNSSPSPNIKKFLANQSSKDIVKRMDPDTRDHDVRIKDLLNELRSETLAPLSPTANSFRQRRLTFGSNSKGISKFILLISRARGMYDV
jgi:hypothetical protein